MPVALPLPLAAGAGTLTNGIIAVGRFNATIRHCNIRGFYIGIYFYGGGGGHTIEDNRFDGNTAFGMYLLGDGSVIRRNRIFDTGDAIGTFDAYGIYVDGSIDILNNTVSGVVAAASGNGKATGIYSDHNLSGRIIGNGVSGLAKDGTGVSLGIYNLNSGYIILRNNDVVGDGTTGGIGLRCTTGSGGARDNVIGKFLTAIENCTDSGGNTVIP